MNVKPEYGGTEESGKGTEAGRRWLRGRRDGDTVAFDWRCEASSVTSGVRWNGDAWVCVWMMENDQSGERYQGVDDGRVCCGSVWLAVRGGKWSS